ncbi:GTPase Era involved in 16S rRNA processing [Paenibacillus sp. DS2015]|uniref:dynamin family protein n=1 Tax=Paenibacillus sp. DS2015 TaxID=3373917 RepID=UPI003D1C8073
MVAQSQRSDVSDVSELKVQLERWNDSKSVKLMDDLLHKKASGELTIALCGHFSAGKSSLINTLCGTKVLPSGPIPTSANVVSIRNGQPRALIYPADLSPTREVSLDELEAYCTNGGDYLSINVWADIPWLGDSGVLMDTPGVDSTDDGHQKATHSALHLADVVLYVMDYNHVQSENNLVFAKSLSEWGKPLYLIVNQIDKHRDQELPLSVYQQEVEAAFSRWQVTYKGLVFTSLKNMDHLYNQFEDLKDLIGNLIMKKEELLEYSISCSVHHVVEDAAQQFCDSHETEKESLLEEMGGEDHALKLQTDLARIEESIKQLEVFPQQEREALREELSILLDNANLMPAELREMAQEYLESRKPGFKKGLWFSGNKTALEQNQRQDRLVHRLQEQVASQVEWHVRVLLTRWAEKHQLWEDTHLQMMDEMMPVIHSDILESSAHIDAMLSGEYVLNYCKNVANTIKGQYRRNVQQFTEPLLVQLAERCTEQQGQQRIQLAELQQQSAAASRYASLLREETAHAAALAELLPPRRGLTPGLLPMVSPLQPPAPAVAAAAQVGALRVAPTVSPAAARGGADLPHGGATGGRRQRLAGAAAQLQAAAALLAGYPAMASAARGLQSRAAALEGGAFTLALFGAFSAGKSSFANALLGEDVLPVSPHPTTAAINRILAPHGDFLHGTAKITMKSREAFAEDLKLSLGMLHLSGSDIDNWREVILPLSSEGIHPAGLPHYGFLKAAATGWEAAQGLLGTAQIVDIGQYRSYVAEESKSCFVESIDLFYSCDLTEQGIVLVDTPGADSLHARHTGVTFQYMKHADALVFVTYYNHAFSKGDRQFLAQLGRVKDSFALDKMFFIINAADLAASDDELEQVKQHVKSNLQSSGIRSPHLYALSSMNALDAKVRGDGGQLLSSGFSSFEQTLADFAGKELPSLSIQAAKQEIVAARKRAEGWDKLSRQDEVTRSERLLQLFEIRSKVMGMLETFTDTEDQQHREIEQETKELLFHVRQRIQYNLGSFFQEAFHPSLLKDGIGSLKEIYTDCGRELENSLLRELDQELWATTLRLEIKSKAIVQDAAFKLTIQINEMDESLLLTPLKETKEWSVPELEDSKLVEPVNWSSMWSMFKGPKLFFEGNGREKLKLAVEPTLKEGLSAASLHQQPLLIHFYVNQLHLYLLQQRDALKEQLEENLGAMESSLQSQEATESWRKLARNLEEFEQIIL